MIRLQVRCLVLLASSVVTVWSLMPLSASAQSSKTAPSKTAKPPAKSAAKSGQPAGKSDASSSIVIGTVAAERGTTAAIPLYYQPAKNTSARSLHLVLDFVSNSIKFAKAEKGVAGEAQEFEITAEAKELPLDTKDEKKIQHSQLTVDVSLPDSSTQKSLPEGLLAFLNFKVPDDAKPFSISLTPVSITAQDSAKKPVEVAAEAGKVIVSVPDEPLAGCFFFTH
jgi:hypothetical protein